MRIISPYVHGILDYVLVAFLFASPTLFKMEGTLAMMTYALGVTHLLVTVLTAFQLGVIRVIPFRIHGILEVVVAILLALMSFWFYNNGEVLGFYFYMILAIVILIIFVLTDYRAIIK